MLLLTLIVVTFYIKIFPKVSAAFHFNPCYLPCFIEVFDSYGSIKPSGLLEGVFADFGEYYECLNIESPIYEDINSIKGKYCLMNVTLPIPPIDSSTGQQFKNGLTAILSSDLFITSLNNFNGTFYRMGICIPSQCNAHEFEHLLNTGNN